MGSTSSKYASASPAPEASCLVKPALTGSTASMDGSLLLGMERTLFSSLNVAGTVMFVGMGLMMVGASDNDFPDTVGTATIAGGVIFALGSWALHGWRCRVLCMGGRLNYKVSMFWTFALVVLLCSSVCVELWHAIQYPYLKRSKVVEV